MRHTHPQSVIVTPLSDSPFVSQIYAGLFALAARKRIRLTYTTEYAGLIHEREWGSNQNRRIAFLELHRGGERIRICYDMLDGPEIVSLTGLEACDFYFKRSYSRAYLHSESDTWQTEHPEWREKILPFGFNFPCGTEQSRQALRFYIALHRTLDTFKRAPRRALTDALIQGALTRSKWRPLRRVSPDTPAPPRVLFQTRLFDPAKHVFSRETEELNAYRLEVLRALRRDLGTQFIGGLIPNEYARKKAPDLITMQPADRVSYLNLVKSARVAVFTRGIRQSTGWRLPEYLGMSRCIVTEPLEYEVPVGLTDGINHLSFDNPQECINACKRLLEDETLANRMRRANHEYFDRHLSAENVIARSLDAAFAQYQVQHLGAGTQSGHSTSTQVVAHT